MLSTGEELPPLLSSICGNEDVHIIKIFINLPALSEISCSLIVLNIQQHQAGDQWLVQTALIQYQNYPIQMIN